MSRCFLYFLSGQKYTARFLVSLASLRRFHDEPVVVLTPDPVDQCPASKVANELHVKLVNIPLYPCRRNACFVTKTMLHRYTPHEDNIFLDADTQVFGKLDELWPRREGEIVVTQFSDWVSCGPRMAGRFEEWRKVCPRLVDRMVHCQWPAINNGVLGFSRKSPCLEAWHELTIKNIRFICDETALGLIWLDYPHRVVSDHYNFSPHFGKDNNPAVIHYHGRSKHTNPDLGKKWVQFFRHEVWDANVCRCRDWLPATLTDDERKLVA